LTKNDIKAIIEIQLAEVAKRLADKGLSFTLLPAAKEFLASKGYEPQYGARPLNRAIQRHLEDPLAEEILRGQYAGDCDILIDCPEGEEALTFTFNPKQSEKPVAP
jgi:ATP-dependent Clp protease ATP-binding subunit ClpC